MRSYKGIFFTERSNPGLARQMFDFRTELFVKELGWSVPMQGGIERDQFDTSDAVYCALIEDGELIGSFRAISCTHPYLARTIFPHLATLESYPVSPDAAEISRLGVKSGRSTASVLLYSLMIRFGVYTNASRLVALVELSHERLLNKIGLKTVRYGETQIVGFKDDGTWILGVAGEIPINAQESANLNRIIHLTREMEIRDETEIFGRQRLSA
ncbi:MAG: acyl-homoserine-lactone synthase [Pseudolabrys sp.]